MKAEAAYGSRFAHGPGYNRKATALSQTRGFDLMYAAAAGLLALDR